MCWVLTRLAMDEEGDYEGTEVLGVYVRYRAALDALEARCVRGDGLFEVHGHNDDGLLMEYSVTFDTGETYTLTRTTLDRGW